MNSGIPHFLGQHSLQSTFEHTPSKIMINSFDGDSGLIIFEPPRGKTNNVVSEQVQHKSGCTVTEAS